MRVLIPALTAAVLVGLANVSLAAAGAPEADQQQRTNTACDNPPSATPATPPVIGKNSGTAPGNAGKTGWTGGAGGAFSGTSQHAATPGSPIQQPKTARGLDPTKPGPEGKDKAAC